MLPLYFQLRELVYYMLPLYFQQAGARELEEYRDNVIKIYDKNADGKLSRDELGMLLSVDK